MHTSEVIMVSTYMRGLLFLHLFARHSYHLITERRYAVPTLRGIIKSLFWILVGNCFIMAISMIERRSAWYDIYDERGKKQKTLSENIGEMLGWGTNFFIVRRSAWYDLYDESGKKYKTLSESIGSFVSISGDTFVIRRSAWLDTYDRFGKKINTRSAR